jgi:hypothetical protein
VPLLRIKSRRFGIEHNLSHRGIAPGRFSRASTYRKPDPCAR